MKPKLSHIIIVIVLIIIAGIYVCDKYSDKSCLKLGELPEEFISQDTLSFFDKQVFKQRRHKISAGLDADIIIVSSHTAADFRYFTGFDERNGIAVFIPSSEKPYTLFVTPREIYTVMWTGEVHGIGGAMETFGADTAFAITSFDSILTDLLKDKKHIYLSFNDTYIKDKVGRVLSNMPQTYDIHDITPVIHEHRIFKCGWEIAQIKQAVGVTIKAHEYVMQTIKPGMKETDVQADIELIFRRNGMGRAFSTIVGSGPNTCLLHYSPGNRIIQDGDLILIDIGASSHGDYSSDVTRTIPANGKFSPEQRTIYELVLKASDEAIKLMKPGHKMLDCHHKAMDVLVEGLFELGLITDTSSWWQKRFYLQHRVNHYIGLQTHDAGDYGYDISNRDNYILAKELRGRDLEAGMVMSLEPGLYFMKGLLDGIHEMFGHLATKEELNTFVQIVRPIYEKYEGIGVRIEDDILITEDGHENLSASLPKTIEEIERFMK